MRRRAVRPRDRSHDRNRLPSRHRFLEPIHNVKDEVRCTSIRGRSRETGFFYPGGWWSLSGSNRRPQACKASALPTELRPRKAALVGRVGVEPTTSRLSGVRSNHLSYRPSAYPNGPSKDRGRGKAAQATAPHQPCGCVELISRMKGHEDGGQCSLERPTHFRNEPGAVRPNP